MSTDTTNLREQLHKIIPEIVDAREGIDSEGIADLLHVSHKDASDAVAELCESGVLAPADE